MPDDPKKRGGQYRRRINVNQDDELRKGALKFGISREVLEEAVHAVGDHADAVERHLNSQTANRSDKNPQGDL